MRLKLKSCCSLLSIRHFHSAATDTKRSKCHKNNNDTSHSNTTPPALTDLVPLQVVEAHALPPRVPDPPVEPRLLVHDVLLGVDVVQVPLEGLALPPLPDGVALGEVADGLRVLDVAPEVLELEIYKHFPYINKENQKSNYLNKKVINRVRRLEAFLGRSAGRGSRHITRGPRYLTCLCM